MSSTNLDQASTHLERRLAVMTLWGLLGSFGMAFLLSGFGTPDWGLGLLGYAFLITAFVAHVLVNHFFESGFQAGEVALGLVMVGFLALVFVANVLFGGGSSPTKLGLGLAGFLITGLAIVLYMIIRYGTRGTWNVVHSFWYRKAEY